MKQSLINENFPIFLGQLNVELQMAIDYIKTLMNRVDVRSNSSTASQIKTRSENLNKDSSILIEDKISSSLDNFEEECNQRPEISNKNSFTVSEELPEEPNYYYGGKLFTKGSSISRLLAGSHKNSNSETDNLPVDNLKKTVSIKSTSNTQNKIPCSENLQTLFLITQNVQVNHVKKLDVPTLDKRTNKMNAPKQDATACQKTVGDIVPISTQTSAAFVSVDKDENLKIDVQSAISTETYHKSTQCDSTQCECTKCDSANTTEATDKYVSKEIQTQGVYTNTSVQTRKSVCQSGRCEAAVNANLNQKIFFNSSIANQTCNLSQSNDIIANSALLKHLDTGLQTSFAFLPEPEKYLADFKKQRKLKLMSSNSKKNDKICLYQVADNPQGNFNKKCVLNELNNIKPLRWKKVPKKVKLLRQGDLYNQYQNRLYENTSQGRNRLNCIKSPSNNLILLPADRLFDKHINSTKQFYKPIHVKKAATDKNVYDTDNIVKNLYYKTNPVYQPKFENEKIQNTRKINDCVNFKGVNIQASRKVTLLDILNTI